MSDTASASSILPLQNTTERILPSLGEHTAAVAADASGTAWTNTMMGTFERLGWLVDAGGPVVVILLLLSTVALAVVLLKWWQFAQLKLESLSAVDEALESWRRHDSRTAIARLTGQQQPTARLVRLALVNLTRPDIERADLREELTRAASAQLENLRSHLRTLEVIATLSPLLGLLGTVLGMIEAFQQLEASANQINPGILSGGIWQALLTTALGLGVAIPVVLAHSWLERKVDRCRHSMEDAVTKVFTRDLQHENATESGKVSTAVAEHAV